MIDSDPIISRYWPATAHNRILRTVLLVLAGTVLLTVSAQFKVPYYPVPMTLQTLAVLLLGVVYGPGAAAASVISYLLLGAAGAPVFAGGGGFAYLIGPTGGFLFSFLPAAALAGYAVKRHAAGGFIVLLLFMLAATLLIYVCGASYLAAIIGIEKALTLGVYPFIIGDISKAVLAAVLAAQVVKRRAG